MHLRVAKKVGQKASEVNKVLRKEKGVPEAVLVQELLILDGETVPSSKSLPRRDGVLAVPSTPVPRASDGNKKAP